MGGGGGGGRFGVNARGYRPSSPLEQYPNQRPTTRTDFRQAIDNMSVNYSVLVIEIKVSDIPS